MISASQIQEILSLYRKHGWTLRKVLLSPGLKKHLTQLMEIFSEVEITDAEIDAVWFSRASGKDKEAWELRRLSATPYALFEIFESNPENEAAIEIRRAMETKLKGTFTV